MALVLDASAAMSIVLGKEEGLALQPLVLEDEEIYAPDLFQVEVANGFWKYVHTGKMDRSTARSYYKAAQSLVNRYVRLDTLVTEALNEAIRLDHPMYDMLYLVLARRLGATLASLDQRLLDLCKEEGVDHIAAVVFS